MSVHSQFDGSFYVLRSNGIGALDPADTTTYYFGSLVFTTAAGYNRLYFGYAGIVTQVFLNWVNYGTAGSNTPSSVYMRINDTTDYLLTSSLVTNTANIDFNCTGLSIPVAVGDFFEYKWTSPSWPTNPTQLLDQMVAVVQMG